MRDGDPLWTGCMSCDTKAGKIKPPGGFVGGNEHWLFFLESAPLLVAGKGYVILKRHCEHLDELTPDETAGLGPMLRDTTMAVRRALKPVRVHLGLYAEGVHHIHFHVVPRMAHMPASNIKLAYRTHWYRILRRLGLKHPYDCRQVARIAVRMRAEFQRSEQTDFGGWEQLP